MTQYTVHLYREMRVSYAGIEADTPEAAAAIAHDRATDEADNIEDCNGCDLSALVDVAGNEDYSQSVTIDFEAERARKAAALLLNACRLIIERWEHGDLAEAARACQSTVELATAGGPPWDITEGRRCGHDPATQALLAALEGIIGYAESEAESLDSLKDGPEAEAEAMTAWRAIEAAHTAIAEAKAYNVTPAVGNPDIHAQEAFHESEA